MWNFIATLPEKKMLISYLNFDESPGGVRVASTKSQIEKLEEKQKEQEFESAIYIMYLPPDFSEFKRPGGKAGP